MLPWHVLNIIMIKSAELFSAIKMKYISFRFLHQISLVRWIPGLPVLWPSGSRWRNFCQVPHSSRCVEYWQSQPTPAVLEIHSNSPQNWIQNDIKNAASIDRIPLVITTICCTHEFLTENWSQIFLWQVWKGEVPRRDSLYSKTV